MSRVLTFRGLLISLLEIALLSIFALPQTRQRPSGYQDLLKNFDVNATKLPPYYKGHNPATLYELLRSLHPKKDEYETTDKFNLKLDSYQKVITSHIYAFRIEDVNSPVRSLDNYQTTYDADSRTLRVKVGVYPTSENGQIVNLKNYTQRRSSTGRNSFGAKVRVSTLVGFGYHLLYWTKRQPEMRIEMPPERAQRIRPLIGILLVCQLTIPSDQDWPITSTMVEKEATFTDPEATEFEARVFTTYLYSIWVFNKATGEVIGKIDMEETAKEK